eukprot:1159421-Pelagomonas_calceolata.AAC.2
MQSEHSGGRHACGNDLGPGLWINGAMQSEHSGGGHACGRAREERHVAERKAIRTQWKKACGSDVGAGAMEQWGHVSQSTVEQGVHVAMTLG